MVTNHNESLRRAGQFGRQGTCAEKSEDGPGFGGKGHLHQHTMLMALQNNCPGMVIDNIVVNFSVIYTYFFCGSVLFSSLACALRGVGQGQVNAVVYRSFFHFFL